MRFRKTNPSGLTLATLTLATLSLSGSAAAQATAQTNRRVRRALPTPQMSLQREVLDRSLQAPLVELDRSLVSATRPNAAAEATPRSSTAPAPALDRSALSQPAGEVLYQQDENGAWWVKGSTYKASFDAAGATYTPFLGSDAERSYPLSMRVAEATLGGVPLVLEAPVLQCAGDRIQIDRGALRAEYVPGLSAVEQLFVLDAPAGSSGAAGDLVVTLDVETELQRVSRDGGFDFEGPTGGVRYGAAFVIDAAGRRLATPAQADGEELHLRVPAAFLSAATYPLAIDPLITTNSIDSSSAIHHQPDIAWDPVSNTFLVTYEEVFSATDYDVKIVKTDINGNVLGSPYYADFSGVHARAPRVAVNRYDRRALIVYTTGPDGDRLISGNLIDLTTTAGLGVRFTVSENLVGLDLSSPDVAGDAFNGPDAWFTVVWQRTWTDIDADIVLRQVTPTGFLLPQQLVTNYIDVLDEAPSIADAPSDRGIHTLVWRRNGNSVIGAQYDFGGYVATPEFGMFAFDPSLQLSAPDVSSLGPVVPGSLERTYAVALSIFFPESLQSDVALFAYAGNQFIDSAQDTYLEHIDFLDDQLRPTVASSGEGFAVAYESGPDSFSVHTTRITSFNLANRSLAVAERRVLGDLSAADHFNPQICSLWESGEDGVGYEFGPFAVVSTAGGQVEFGGYMSYPVCGAQYEFCYGTNNSRGERSYLTVQGDADDTAAIRTMRVTGLPFNKPGIFFASRSVAATGFFPPGSAGRLCLLNPIGRYTGFLNSGSSGSVAMTLDPTALPQAGGTVAAFAGETWYFQFWHRDNVGGVPSSNFSNATAIPFH